MRLSALGLLAVVAFALACGDDDDHTGTDADLRNDASTASSDAGARGADAGRDHASNTGTFPAIGDPSDMGPYTPVTVTETGPNGVYTLYHPMELAPDGKRNPVVTWGNGGYTMPSDYPLLPHLASHGFVVIAANNMFVSGPEVRAGLDWIIERNADSASDLYQKLDVEKVAGIGYSNGGLATLSVSDDPRYVTLVIISGATMNDSSRSQSVPKIHTPTAFLCTADDASRNNCAGDFGAIQQPAFFGVLVGSVHTSVTNFANLGDPVIMKRLIGATTAWLRWRVMDDQTFKAMFVGSDCGLCKDENWTVEPQKNLN